MAEDRTNMYELQEDWLQNIVPKYFDLEDLSLNRVGLFGYINELMAHNTESIVNENSVLYNELFFKRAVLPQSIYSYASHYGITDTTAKPATMNFVLGINEQTLLSKSITDSTGSYFIIDSDSHIIVESSIIFMIDYDIKISIKTDNSGNYVYSAKYVTESLDNPLSSIKSYSNPFIKLTKMRSGTTDYIFVYVEAHQYEKIEKNKNIYSEDFIEYFSFDMEYDASKGQLADFSVFYREPNVTTFKQIEKKLIDSAATEKPFCFYQFKDNNKVNITFSNIMRFFRPKFNSELNFVFYNTLGAGGNFKYTGTDVAINLKSKVYDYRDVIMIAKSTSDSVGGLDSKTYEEIKEQVSIKASTCAIIGTEIDLNKYFEAIEEASKMLFVKKRDDILDRTFGAFLLMRDSKGNLVPTNTVDVDIYTKDFDLMEENTKRYVVKAGKSFIYKPNDRTVKVKDVTNMDGIRFEYANPFTMVVNRQPFFIEYFLTAINKKYVPEFALVNDSTYTNFITNSIQIYRDAIHSDTYEMTFNTVPNLDNVDIDFANVDPTGKFVSDNGNMKIVGVFYDSYGEVSHYYPCNMIDYDKLERRAFFKSGIKTDDFISIYSHLRITEGIVDVNSPLVTQPMIPATKLKIGFLVFIKETPTTYTHSKYHDTIPGLTGYTLSNVFNIDDEVDFINNLNRMMYSSILFEKDTNGELYYHVKEVPMIRKDYIYNTEYGKEFIQKFLSDFSILDDTIANITNSFEISTKFYNTYGKSYYFYINEKTTNTLDRVNLSINLRIKLNPNKIMDNLLKEEIRTFIKDYIESVNEDINWYWSNLSKALENNFRDIKFIQFRRVNEYGSEVQTIEKNFPSSDAVSRGRLKEFVPEFLNINKVYDGYDNVQYEVLVDFI